MRKIVFKDEGIRLEDGGFISNLEDGSDALDIITEGASVNISRLTADRASLDGDYILPEKILVITRDVIDGLIFDADTESIDSICADGGN